MSLASKRGKTKRGRNVEHIIPATILVLANLTSGKHGSRRYELWSAVFGYISALAMVLAVVSQYFTSSLHPYFYQIAGFCLITVLSRDYEKWLKPFFKRFEDKE